MKNSAADLMSTVHNELSTELVNRSYSSKILEVAQNLPMLSVISYECRLAHDAPQVDIALCAYGRNDGLTLMEKTIPNFVNNGEDQLAFKAWQKVRKFGKIWVNEGFMRQFVSALWLNIDIELGDNSIAEPWIYVIFVHTQIPVDVKIAIVTKSLYLFQPNFPELVVDQMVTQIHQLPKKAHLLGLGLQSSRQKETLRLVIYELNLSEITNFLEHSNWSGDHDDFYNRMAEFAPFAVALGFIFDVDEFSVSALVGVEFYTDRGNHAQSIEKLLQLLVERDLCSEKKSKEIMDWIKVSNIRTEDNLERWVSHVKITYEPGKNSKAKIYLFHQFDLDPNSSFQSRLNQKKDRLEG